MSGRVGAEDLEGVRRGLARIRDLMSSKRAASALSDATGITLSSQALRVLDVLGDGQEWSPGRLARRARMDPGAVSRQLKALEADGLAVRVGTGRLARVVATARGAEAADRIRRARSRHLLDAMSGWSREELRQLGTQLERLVEDLSHTPYRND